MGIEFPRQIAVSGLLGTAVALDSLVNKAFELADRALYSDRFSQSVLAGACSLEEDLADFTEIADLYESQWKVKCLFHGERREEMLRGADSQRG